MAPLVSKINLNKLRHDVHNEVTLICAKFGKDLFNISKVIGRKTKWPCFLAYPVCVQKLAPNMSTNGTMTASAMTGALTDIVGVNTGRKER